MTCVEWEIWISAYHDDALDAERRRAVEAHLVGCALCRAYSEAMAAMGPMLQAAMTRAEAPETLYASVMTQLPETAARSPRWKPVLRPPRGWLSFGLAPVGIALWLLMAGPSAPKPETGPQRIAATPPAVEKTVTPRSGGTKKDGNSRQPSGTHPNRATPVHKGSPTRVSPTPPPDPRPELEPLRRMQHRRPPRFQDRLVRRPGSRLAAYRPGERYGRSARHRSHRRYRPRPGRRTQPLLLVNQPPVKDPLLQIPQSGERKPESWVTVVDYVLPQAAPETAVGEGTEFVLRAAETYQVTPTSYEY